MKKYHVVYKTTNLINNKIYIGFHSTDYINDSYIGSGKVMKEAIKKYSKHNFSKEILAVFNCRKEARELERKLVNDDFIKRKDIYNLILGGSGIDCQDGPLNHMWGKLAHNRKPVKATHKDGREVVCESIQELSEVIKIARGNIRNLLKKKIRGKLGWKIEYLKDIV